MIALDRVKACSNPECREVLPADPYDPDQAGFYVSSRKNGRVYFRSLCKPCYRQAARPRRPKNHRVHVAEVDGRERHVKFCSGCGQVKVAEAGVSDSGFYVSRLKAYVTFYRLCKECTAAQRKARRRTDAGFRARELAARQRWVERNRERQREAQREWHRSWRRAHREQYNELQRMAYRLRAERKGVQPLEGRRRVIDGTRPELPLGPFREWLRAYQRARELSVPELALELGLVERRARSLLAGGQASVSVDVVSRALTEARTVVSVGDRMVVTIDDLYLGLVLRERRRPRGTVTVEEYRAKRRGRRER